VAGEVAVLPRALDAETAAREDRHPPVLLQLQPEIAVAVVVDVEAPSLRFFRRTAASLRC
jgi:hypothetical protein